MKAVVYTLGCKVNDVESGSIIRGLEDMGYCVSREMEKADLYIINTCAVTAEAERKSRQTIGKAIKCNPDAKIIICGCASEKSPQAFMEKGATVYAVTGAQRKNSVLEIVKDGLEKSPRGICIEQEKNYEEMPLPECLKTRNFVKIQDGCNRFCSYCVIPYLRGRSRSRSVESAAEEILASTALETVITGIDISDYKDEQGRDLADLIYAIRYADTRIRLGSLEVSAITPRLIENLHLLKNFAPQFHLSLQSGSNKVLKSMNRHYTREEYLEKCKLLYDSFPNAAITTDIIVGFPTETEEDFFDSLRIVKEAGFSQIHAFPYSPREGTNAYKRYKELPFAVKKERVERILEEGEHMKARYLNKFLGRGLVVIPESYYHGMTVGYSENYIRVYIDGEHDKKEPIRVCVQGNFLDGVLATKTNKKF